MRTRINADLLLSPSVLMMMINLLFLSIAYQPHHCFSCKFQGYSMISKIESEWLIALICGHLLRELLEVFTSIVSWDEVTNSTWHHRAQDAAFCWQLLVNYTHLKTVKTVGPLDLYYVAQNVEYRYRYRYSWSFRLLLLRRVFLLVHSILMTHK